MKNISFLILFSLIFYAIQASGQPVFRDEGDSNRMEILNVRLKLLAERDKTYNEVIDISVGKIPLSDMLRNVAKASNVNLSVKGAENTLITCNFSRAKITDLLFFICKEYDLDLDIVGNIVSLQPLEKSTTAKTPKIDYSLAASKLSYDLNGDALIDVVKKITSLTGNNIIVPQPLYSRQISGYVDNMKFDDAITSLFTINGLHPIKLKNGSWEILSPAHEGMPGQSPSVSIPIFNRSRAFSENQLFIDSLGMITAQIGRGNIRDIISDLCEQQELNYFFISPVDHQTSVFVKDVDFESLLYVLMEGTQYSYYMENGIYMFGNSTQPSTMLSVRVIPLYHRSANNIEEIIPETLKNGVQIKQFLDLNSVIASGDQKTVSRIENFIRSIDRRVPLVTIEVIIVDASKTNIQEAGITMGKGKNPVNHANTLSPGIDMGLSSTSVNKLINSFNGFGSVNLGKVNSDFYMGLRFLEETGKIELRSTPKLSTLNGHEATLKSGELQYYKEVMNTLMGSQTPVQTETFVWKSVEANLILKIIPYVSADQHITMDIEIEQTEFTVPTQEEAPPGSTTRSFKSQIRVENEEMVLLGGIDRNLHDKSSGGVPFIARVPVLKWIFGKSKNKKEDLTLNVFIKPTLIE